jgi:hypothetical protein
MIVIWAGCSLCWTEKGPRNKFFLAENDDSNLGRVFAVLDRERSEEQIDTDVELYDKM